MRNSAVDLASWRDCSRWEIYFMGERELKPQLSIREYMKQKLPALSSLPIFWLFFRLIFTWRIICSQQLSRSLDNATYPNFSFIPTFNGLYSNKLISWCIFSFEIEKVVIKMCIFYTFPKYRRNKQTSRTWKSWNNHEVSGYNNKAAISRISYIGGREKLFNDKAMETAKCWKYPWLLQFHLIFLSQLFGYVYS